MIIMTTIRETPEWTADEIEVAEIAEQLRDHGKLKAK